MEQAKKNMIKDYAAITLGMFIASLGLYFFMMPQNIILGSITGLAIILTNFIPIQVSVMTFILNVICLVIGFVLIGKEFGAKTVYSSILLPVFLFILEHVCPNPPSLTNDVILDTLACILILSVGQAMMFNANASSGGLDILAKVANKYLHIELGMGVASVGALTVLCSIFAYDSKTVVVGLLGTYFNGLVVDAYIGGFSRRKRVCILSPNQEKLIDYIMHTLNRGVTLYDAQGGFDRKGKTEVVTILANNEYSKLMEYIRNTDPQAFVTVSTVNEIAGMWNTPSGQKRL